MYFKTAIGAAISSIVMATAAAAATLSISGGEDFVLGSDHNPDYTGLYGPLVPGVGVGSTVKAFGTPFEAFNGTNGLEISSNSTVKITYLGKEASATNTALNLDGGVLSNQTNTPGDHIYAYDMPAFINFAFSTIIGGGSESITNGVGQTDDRLSIAFYWEDEKNVLAFFGDGRADDLGRSSDFDDMIVRISVVPLPAGGVLLLTALGGMAVARRRKKA